MRAELASLLEDAGRLASTYFGRVPRELKPDGSWVTEADRAVEALIVDRLARAFPGESVVCEEGHVVEAPPGAPAWYVDPIDGTGAFLSGLAYWGPTVCRVVDGQLQVGAFYVPRLRELWYAERGGGAYRDDQRLPVLGPTEGEDVLRNDVLFAPSRFHRRLPVPWAGKVRALGSSAAHMAHVASNGGSCAVIPKWALWDVGCGALLIGEVGRVIWDAFGAPVEPERITPGLPILVGAPTALRTLIADGWAGAVLGAGATPPGTAGR